MIDKVGQSAASSGPGGGGAAAAAGTAAAGGALPLPQTSQPEGQGAKFGEVWQNIQGKYGAKAEKPREIKKTLGKDDFLRIMITQMKHQDPTQPFKAEQFAAELAQFTSVEQLQNLNQSMTKMANQNQPLERLAMTGMIGKTVTIDKERFPHTEGQVTPLSFVLPKDAKECKVSILSEAGEAVFEQEMGELKAGENGLQWDGAKKNGMAVKTGTYMLRIEARDDRGQSLDTSPKAKSRVIGISFEGTEPHFLVGNPNAPEKITMRNIVRIESDGQLPTIGQNLPQKLVAPGVQAAAAAAGSGQQAAAAGSGAGADGGAAAAIAQAQQQIQQQFMQPVQQGAPGGAKSDAFFTFQKGVGSKNVDANRMTPEVQAALAKFQEQAAEYQQAQRAQEAAQKQANAVGVEKGFPSGLGDPDAVPQKSGTIEKGGEKR